MSTSDPTRPNGHRISETGTARAILMLGVIITAASFLALVVTLILYFIGADGNPVLHFTVLWGFPVGFTLMIVHVLYAMSRRRRRAVVG